jgi:hypothetical protein
MDVADVQARIEPVVKGVVAHVQGALKDPKKYSEDPRARAAGAVVGALVLLRMLRRRR